MAQLDDYRAFAEVLDRGSLTAAARQLGRSVQAVSRALLTLERELGAELVRRTTRRLQATPAGLLFHRRIKAVLLELDEARAEAALNDERIAGAFRIGASVLFASHHVTPAAVAFFQRYPALEIEMVLSDAMADLIKDRIDVAIRVGTTVSSTLKTRRLAMLRRVVVASPDYLARHGRPQTPGDLADHCCVVRTFGPEGDVWPLTIDGKQTPVAVRGSFRCNDAASANAAVVAGAGLGVAPLWQVRADLDLGRLEMVLGEFEPPAIPVQAVWPGNAGTPARTRLFVDSLAARLQTERL